MVLPLEKGLSNFTVSLSSCGNNMFLFSCPQNGTTPLIEAVNRGHESIVVLLLQHKADPNISTKVSTDTVSVRVICITSGHMIFHVVIHVYTYNKL